MVTITFYGMVYNRYTQSSTIQATVTNISSAVLASPMYLVINAVSPSTVTVSNSDGTTSEGRHFYDLGSYIPGSGLGPGEVSSPLYLNLSNPLRAYFTIEASVYIAAGSPTLESLEVIPATVTITVGGSEQLSVMGHYSDGSTGDLTLSSTGTSYLSQNMNVATISTEGLVTGVAPGTMTIEVHNEQITTQVAVTVTGVTDVTPPAVTITSPAEAETTNASPITVSGTIYEEWDLATVLVNGQAATIGGTPPNYTFTAQINLLEGENLIQVMAQDGTGNEGQAQASITLDIQPPQIVITNPANGTETYSSTITITGTVDDPTALVVINGIQVPVSNQTFTYEGFTLQEGSNEIIATAQDTAGNTASAQIVVTYILLNSPQVTILSPADGTIISASSVTVTGTVDDPTSTVTVNGVGATVNSDGSFQVSSVPLNEGSNTITATAGNPAGQGRAVITVIRDSHAPVITLTSPQDGATVNTGSIDITGSVDDLQSQISINGYQAVITAEGIFTVSSLPLTEGENQLTIIAQDTLGNSAQMMVTVILDTTAPTIQILNPSDGAITNTTSLTVSGSIFEEVGPVTALVNGQAATIGGTQPNYTFTTQINLLEGENQIQVMAQDSSGNEGQAQASITLDTQAPQVTITTPQDGTVTHSSAITITGTVDDPAAQVNINGLPITLVNQEFTIEDFSLHTGSNEIVITAMDLAGNAGIDQITITYSVLYPPQVSIVSPTDGSVVAAESISVTGTVDDPGATVTVNNQSATVDSQGNFTLSSLPLNEGSNTISIMATNGVGTDQAWIQVTRDTTPPAITLTYPQDGGLYKTPFLNITGSVDDPQAQVTINDQSATLDADGLFTLSAYMLTEGENQLTIRALDGAGNSSQISLSVTLDTIAPAIQITSPQPDALLADTPIQIAGNVDDVLATVMINQTQVDVGLTTGDFTHTLSLTEGENTITITAKDKAGNSTSQQMAVYLDTTPPSLMLQSPQDGLLTNQAEVTIQGVVDDPKASVTMSGLDIPVDPDGTFEVLHYSLSEGQNEIIVTASDQAGNSSQVNVTVISDTVSPLTPQLGSLPAITRNHKITITGTTEPGAMVTITGGAGDITAILSDNDGHFSSEVFLLYNSLNTISVVASDSAHNESQAATAQITHDNLAPSIIISSPRDGVTLPQAQVLVTGQVDDAEGIDSVTINNTPLTLDPQGGFEVELTLAEGENHITLKALDSAGNESTTVITAWFVQEVVDNTPPSVTIGSPATGSFLNIREVSMSGTIIDASDIVEIQALLNGQSLQQQIDLVDHHFAFSLTLPSEGTHTISLSAKDAVGLEGSDSITLTLDQTPPGLPTINVINPPSPTNSPEVTLYGTCEPEVLLIVTGGKNEVQKRAGENGQYTITVPLHLNAENTLSLTAKDRAGNNSPAPVLAYVIQDSQPPSVISLNPANGSKDIGLNSLVTVTFSEAMNQENLPDHLTIKDALGNFISWQIDEDSQTSDNIVSLKPAVAWPDSQTITILIDTQAKDIAGNNLPAPFTSLFETIDQTGPDAPAVVSILPSITNLSILSVTGTTEYNAAIIALRGETQVAQATASSGGSFTLDIPLTSDTMNSLSLVAVDTHGNEGTAYTFAVTQDSLSPSVMITPSSGADDVPYDTPIQYTFNEPIDITTIPQSNQPGGSITVTNASNVFIPGQFTINEEQTEVTFMATSPFSDSAQISTIVSSQVYDLAGNPLSEDVASTFSILDQTPPPPPVISQVTPPSPTTAAQVVITGVSEPLALIKAQGPGGQAEATAGSDGSFTVTIALKNNYTNIIKVTATDQKANTGNPAQTEVIHDTIAPQVQQVNPAHLATDIPTGTHLVLTLSEPVDQKTILGEGFPEPGLSVTTKEGTPVPGTIHISQAIVTFVPDAPLIEGTEYTIHLTTQVGDPAGNTLAQAFSSQFTTAGVAPTLVPAAPKINSVDPPSPTSQLSVVISGEAEAGATIEVSGGAAPASTTSSENGQFSLTVTLNPNQKDTLSVTAQNQYGVSQATSLSVIHDNLGPSIVITAPKEGEEVTASSIKVMGTVTDNSDIQSLTVNGQVVSVDSSGGFSATVPLVEGDNTITVSAADVLLNSSQAGISVTFKTEEKDTTPPVVTITSPVNNATVAATTRVQGTVVDASPIKDFTINGFYVPLSGDSFNSLISLSSDDTTITATATDASGLTGSDSISITVDSQAPGKPELDPLPEKSSDTTINITGTADPGSIIEVENSGEVFRQEVDEDGTFEVAVDLTTNNANDLSVKAVDEVGNSSESETVSVTQDANPLIITETYPENNQREIPLDNLIRITFSKPVDQDTLTTPGNFIVLLNGLTEITGTVSLTPGGLIATFTPAQPWPGNSQITIKCTTGITSTDGFHLFNDFVSSFFTRYPPSAVRGVVVDPDMRPLSGIWASISFKGIKTQTDSTGNFSLNNTPPGIIDVLIDGTGADDSRRFGSTTMRVHVLEGETYQITKPIILTPINEESKTIITNDTTSIDFNSTIPEFTLTVSPGSITFPDGKTHGEITATLVDITAMPVQLPDNIIPSLLVMLEPSGVTMNPPAQLTFPNVTHLSPFEEVDVFCLHGAHDFQIIGKGRVSTSGDLIETEICLSHFSYVGYYEERAIGADNRFLHGRVIDKNGVGIAHVPVSVPFSNANIFTKDDGSYLIPIPLGSLPFLRVLATISTSFLGREGKSLVYRSEPVAPLPFGGTIVPDIMVDAFIISGNIRLMNGNDDLVTNSDATVFDPSGNLTTISQEDFEQIKIMVLRESSEGQFLSTPFVTLSPTVSSANPHYNGYFQEIIFNGPEETAIPGERSPVRIEAGEHLCLAGYSSKTGYIGMNEVIVPESIDIEGDLTLYPSEVTLKVERLFFANNTRQRRIIPHGGTALVTDQLILISTLWGTQGNALPQLPDSMSLYGRLMTTAVTGSEKDIRFTIPPGESVRILEIRGSFPDSKAIIDVMNAAGRETIDIASQRSFVSESIIPLRVAGVTGDYQDNLPRFTFTISSDTEIQGIDGFGVDITTPFEGISTISGRAGSAEAGSVVTIINVTTGQSITLIADEDGSFHGEIAASIGDVIQMVSRDDSGNTTESFVSEVRNIPQITTIIPPQANVGATVTIQGRGFSLNTGGNDVRFMTASAQPILARVISASENELTIIVPEGAVSGPVTNTVGGETSNSYQFTVTRAAINHIEPQSSAPGEHLTVTITGENTHFMTDITTVDFGPFITLDSLVVDSPNHLTVALTIRNDAPFGLQRVVIKGEDGTLYAPQGFTVLYPLTASYIQYIEPEQGIPGHQAVIHGSGFRPNIFDNDVYFNNILAAVLEADQNHITVAVPEEYRGGTVAVKIGDLFSNPYEYTLAHTGVLGEISYGDTVTGEIFVMGIKDKYRFSGAMGDRISIALERNTNLPDGTGSLNPFISLLDQHGKWIAVDDNSGSDSPPGPGANAVIDNFMLPEDGVYTIVVVGAGKIDTENINVEDVVNDPSWELGLNGEDLFTTGPYTLSIALK